MLPSLPAFSDELVKISKVQKVPISTVAKKLYRKLVEGSPVKIRITEEARATGGGYFDWGNKEICLSDKDYQVLAHEIGHAHVQEHILGKLIQNVPARAAHLLAPVSGSVGGMLMAQGKTWGLLLPVAVSAPTLISEVLASHKGDQLLTELGIGDEDRKSYRSKMLKAFSTYLTLPVIGTLLAAGTGLHLRRPN